MSTIFVFAWVPGLIVAGICALAFGARADRRRRDAGVAPEADDSVVGGGGSEAARIAELATELHSLGLPVLLEPKEAWNKDAFVRPDSDRAAVVLRI